MYLYNDIIINILNDKNTLSCPSKSNSIQTVFMILNLTKNEAEKEITNEITIGDSKVKRSNSTKLLGMEIDDQHNWKEQFNNMERNK